MLVIKKLIVILALLLAGYLIFFISVYDGVEAIRITVNPGMSVFSINKELSKIKQVNNSWVFYRLSQLLSLDDELQAGVYL